MICRELALVKVFDGGMYVAPLRCRSWGCDYCRPERKKEVATNAALGYPDTLITLTVNPNDGLWPAERARKLVIAWRKFVRFAKKKYGYKSIPYFAVFEATKKMEPHLHILCRVKWIEQRVLSKFMRDAIGAPIVDIRRCNTARSAARYVAKYLGKKPCKFGTCKRYWQTRDYVPQDPDEKARERPKAEGWELREEGVEYFLWWARYRGFHIEPSGDMWKIVEEQPP